MTNADAYRCCFELFIRRDYESCARTSMPLIDEVRTHELLQVFLISLYRSGQHAMAEDLAPAIEEASAHDRWTNALLRLTIGRIGPAEVFGLVSDERSRCRALFYIGANQLTHGYLDEARQMLDASMATGVRCTEADLARIERMAPIRPAATAMTSEQAVWLDRQMGDARKAVQTHRTEAVVEIASHIYEWACRVLDEDSVGMAAALQQIGMIHFFACDYPAARSLFEEAKDLYLENLGGRHQAHIECLQQLAAAEVGAGCSAARADQLIRERRRLLELVVTARTEFP